MRTPQRSTLRAAQQRLRPMAAALATLVAMTAQATTVLEVGDAGETLATAQATAGAPGALTDIFGSIGATNDADVFLINITAPGTFSASTTDLSGLGLDTQLFLFTQAGAPVYANDDEASGLTLLSALPAGSNLGPVTPGLYYLAIALSGRDPVNSSGQLVFDFGLSTDVRGPAFGLQPASLSGFDGTGFGPVGGYSIQLSGATVSAVPEPASALMFLMGGALAAAPWLRRRQRALNNTALANRPFGA